MDICFFYSLKKYIFAINTDWSVYAISDDEEFSPFVADRFLSI